MAGEIRKYTIPARPELSGNVVKAPDPEFYLAMAQMSRTNILSMGNLLVHLLRKMPEESVMAHETGNEELQVAHRDVKVALAKLIQELTTIHDGIRTEEDKDTEE